MSSKAQIALMDKAIVNQMVDFEKIQITPLVQQVDRTPVLTEKDIESAAQIAANEDRIAKLSKSCTYPAELLEFGDINQELVKEMIKTIGDLQPWETLSLEQRQQVLDLLVPYVWIPTLVHEVGHNLGLRHNFSGSEDKTNFYSSDELKAQGVPVSTATVPYSSVMDYPKSEINALRTLGKYDIAALRFGYTGKVELPTGEIAAVDSSTSAPTELKAYDYCSDEGVEPNPTCNPFDEGTGFTEIAKSLIDSYKDGYLRANFRRGRANFSGFDDDFYYSRVNRTFKKLRLLFERYQDLVEDFQLTQEDIDGVDFLKDLDESVVIAADFMMDVIAQPDKICAIATPQGLQIVPIDVFSSGAHNRTRDCFAIQLNDGFQMIGQAGKAINSFKLPTNPNRFADQIDVRGTWIDKDIAMNTLFRRRLFSTLHDDLNGNFMDHPKVSQKLKTFLTDLLNDRLQPDVTFTLADGSEQTIPLGFSMTSASYEVKTSELPIVNFTLGLPYDNMHIVESFANILVRGLKQGASNEVNNQLKSELAVSTIHPGSGKIMSAQVGSQTLFVNENSVISAGLMKSMLRARLYSRVDAATLTKLQNLMQTNSTSDTLTADEQAIIAEGLEPLTQFIEGQLPPASYFEPILLALTKAQ